ncbi:hypothetical protein CDD83_4491 [Cordyceps sp. RAO-2017]|nr:hypothetical protein CDD83_4491 [Cordyceps sp. RAO-2017]
MPRPLRPRLPAPLVLLRRQASGGTKGRGHTAPPPFGARPGDLVNVSSLPGPTGPIRVLELNRPHARNALATTTPTATRTATPSGSPPTAGPSGP